jgi:7-cyano-7-deazaguanine synthase
MAKKAFVLLSGGLDSTTCLYKAIKDFLPPDKGFELAIDGIYDIDWVEAVSINYGQRHRKEIELAKKTCGDLNIKHTTIDLPGAIVDANTMLANPDIQIPSVDYADLPEGVSPTYVPFRNGTMLALLAAHAQKWVNEAQHEYNNKLQIAMLKGDLLANADKPQAGIYFGAHAEDAHNWAYPDCTPEFIGAMANAIYVGTYHAVRLYTPLMTLMKSEIVELGDKLGVPFENTWSCYKGGDKHCGVCPTCRSRRNAFKTAGVPDPTEYAENPDADSLDD